MDPITTQNIVNYLDSTYLKTPEQSGLTEAQTWEKVKALCNEAIENHFFAVMIRPNYIQKVKDYFSDLQGFIPKIGTVISFHEGKNSLQEKLNEAQQAINDGADELDYVINYQEFINGNLTLIEEELLKGSALAIENDKIAKWIIEIAALTDAQIAEISSFISKTITQHLPEKDWQKVFVKSSTGFFPTENGTPNGATFPAIKIMLEHGKPLPIKAAGGVKNFDDAKKMVELGVQRIGTSAAKDIATKSETQSSSSY